jgi:hypothetical protein
MNETSARHVTLIRALETTAHLDAPWSAADAAWASRAATEVVGEGADADRFLSRRGQLAVEKLGDRDKAFKRLASGRNWRPWVGTVLVALSFALGVLMDAVGPTRYVNLLAFPLLGLIVWNLLVYVGILVHGLSDPSAAQRQRRASCGVPWRAWAERSTKVSSTPARARPAPASAPSGRGSRPRSRRAGSAGTAPGCHGLRPGRHRRPVHPRAGAALPGRLGEHLP